MTFLWKERGGDGEWCAEACCGVLWDGGWDGAGPDEGGAVGEGVRGSERRKGEGMDAHGL